MKRWDFGSICDAAIFFESCFDGTPEEKNLVKEWFDGAIDITLSKAIFCKN